MGATQCHQQLLECCRRAGREGVDPEVKEQWMQLAEEWRVAAKQGEAFESRRRNSRSAGNERSIELSTALPAGHEQVELFRKMLAIS
jgi:hypothetical protein